MQRPAPALSALLLVGLALACGSAGREIRSGITFFAADTAGPPSGGWEGSWMDVPLYVSRNPDDPRWIRGERLIRLELAMRRYLPPDRARVGELHGWEEPGHDTVGALRIRPDVRHDRRCALAEIIPGDSVRPAQRGCRRWERERSEFVSPPALQRTAVEVGGNAVLLVSEDPGGQVGAVGGYVLRCPLVRGTPSCGGGS